MGSRCSRYTSTRTAARPGVTLVEVLAALVLLAGCVTVLLLAQARAWQQQAANAEQRQAAALAEPLILEWRRSGQDIGWSGEADFEDRPGWSWQCTAEPIHVTEEEDSAMTRVQLTITVQDPGADRRAVATYTWLEPIEMP